MGAKSRYIYLSLFDVMRAGDESHHRWGLWFPITEDMIGKRRKDVFSYRTRVRRKKGEDDAEIKGGSTADQTES